MNYVLWRTVLSSFCLYGIGLHAFLVSLCVWASTALYMCIFLTVGETCICSFTLDLLHYATGFRQLQFVSIWSRDLLSEYINRLLPSTLLDQQEFFMVNTSSSFFVLLFCFCFVFFRKIIYTLQATLKHQCRPGAISEKTKLVLDGVAAQVSARALPPMPHSVCPCFVVSDS